MYVITNGKNYIGCNALRQAIATRDINQSLHFSSKEKAENYLQNMPKHFRNIGYGLGEVKEEFDVPENDIVQLDEIIGAIPTIETTLHKLIEQCGVIEAMVHKMDAATIDILHYVEFNQLNVVDGYKIYKKLHEIRIQRRKYKDLLRMINVIKGGSAIDIADGALSKELSVLEDRTYSPRILAELFDSTITEGE